jgi:hypothetical protein
MLQDAFEDAFDAPRPRLPGLPARTFSAGFAIENLKRHYDES